LNLQSGEKERKYYTMKQQERREAVVGEKEGGLMEPEIEKVIDTVASKVEGL
jgi:hypothetical protein